MATENRHHAIPVHSILAVITLQQLRNSISGSNDITHKAPPRICSRLHFQLLHF